MQKVFDYLSSMDSNEVFGLIVYALFWIGVATIIIKILDNITYPLREAIATASYRKRKQKNAEKLDSECKANFEKMASRFAQNEMVNLWAQEISECMLSDIKNIMSCSHGAWTEYITLQWEVKISAARLIFRLVSDHRELWGKESKFANVEFAEVRLPELNEQEQVAMTSVLKGKIGSIVNKRVKYENLCGTEFGIRTDLPQYCSWYAKDSDGYETADYVCYYECSPYIVFSARNKAYVEPKAW